MIIPDVSFYQARYEPYQPINFEAMSEKCPAVIIRAGQNTWEDVEFKASWANAKAAGMLRGCYWFYDSRANPKRQAEKWAEVLGGDAGEMELWCDFEDNYGGAYKGQQHWYDFMERVKYLLPHKSLGVYTGYYYWIDNEAGMSSYFAQYPLWIAAYGTTTPRIPAPWKSYLIHQYTDNGIGADWGVASGNIDLNYFNGDLDAYGKPNTGSGILYANFGELQVKYKRLQDENTELRNYALQLDRELQTGES